MSSELERAVGTPRDLSIAHGPFLRVLHRLHLTRGDGTPRASALVALAWVPLFIGALLRITFGERPAPILFDISVHTRLLISLPVMIQAARLLERRCQVAVAQLYDGEFAEPASIDPIIDRAQRLRGSGPGDLVIMVIALLLGQAILWGIVGSSGVFSGITDAGGVSFARVWYTVIALPIAQFFFLRWVWQWLIWTYVVVRVSRLPLVTFATHPDHAAGIKFLSTPVSAFALFVFAFAAMMAAAWGTAILNGHATLQRFVPGFIAFLVVVVLVGCGPLCLYAGILYRARHRDIPRYNALSLDYVRQFDAKWGALPRREPLLGSQDFQAMNDMMGLYEHLDQVSLLPFGLRTTASLWIAALLPMLPLIATTMPLDELVKKLGGALLAGLPI